MSDDRVCVFIGKRNTGKSTLVKDIMYHKKHLPAGIVLSGTEEGNHFYSDFILSGFRPISVHTLGIGLVPFD